MEAGKRASPNNVFFLVLCILVTNTITLSLFSSSDRNFHRDNLAQVSKSLAKFEKENFHLRAELISSNNESKALREQLSHLASIQSKDTLSQTLPVAHYNPDLPKEYLEFVSAHKLPYGHNRNIGSDQILAPAGRACDRFSEDLKRYMDYTVGGPCPDDDVLEQQLLLKGCEPLPRRRCVSPGRLSERFVEPTPFPDSLWSVPDDSSVSWTSYSCKNYTCLVNRKYQKGFDDCKDCFDLAGREQYRWVRPSVGEYAYLDYMIDDVLSFKNGTIRLGLDIGGGSGTFAVRMRERNVTIISTSMNFNAPFNRFMASRGVLPLFVTISQRLPFFDGTLDLVHSMHVLSEWIPPKLLEFIFFDIYRILRPGGVLWLDHFFCKEDQLQDLYVPMIERIGFKKVRWNTGRKLDRGPELKEMYLCALLMKPFSTHE